MSYKMEVTWTCERCKETETIQRFDEAEENKYISGDSPYGWQYINNMDLCPDCSEAFDRFMEE